jgi:flagellar assembly protein FliH
MDSVPLAQSETPDLAPALPEQAVGDALETGTGSEIDEALDVLEAEVETSLNPEALEAIEKEAFNRGRAAAMAEMAEKMQSLKSEMESLQGVVDSVAPLAAELEGLRARMIQQASEDVAEMALHMARRVVGETLAVHPQALRKLVVDAIERLPGDDEITVRVRPQDLQSIQDSLPVRRDIRIVEDDSLEGGCVVQAQCGEVSASIETAFTGLRAAVDEWLEDQK